MNMLLVEMCWGVSICLIVTFTTLNSNQNELPTTVLAKGWKKTRETVRFAYVGEL